MPLGRTPITWNMTVRDALLNVVNEDMEELFSRVEALELGVLSGVAIATEEEAIAGVDNTKAMTPLRTRQAFNEYVSLGVNADTLDGDHSTAFRRNDENINLSQGQIVDFADEAGDKIRLYGTQYGVAVNPNELTLYKPSTSEIAIRDSAYNGQKLGEVIHTGNMSDKGVAMKLSMIASTAGDFVLRRYRPYTGTIVRLGASYLDLLELVIPWTGTMRYYFGLYNDGQSPSDYAYLKFNDTVYGPYTVNYNAYTYTSVDVDNSNTGLVTVKGMSTYGKVSVVDIKIQTGNFDILHEIITMQVYSSLNIVQ